jgi:hypothetical protein
MVDTILPATYAERRTEQEITLMRRLKMRALLILSISLLLISPAAESTVIVVDQSGEGDYLTIKEGVAAADEGDTVIVAAGTYTGLDNKGISFGGTNMVLMSEDGAENTIIDCENAGYAMLINGGEDSTSVIRGFTIKDGVGGNGGGIKVHHASARVEDCIFYGNSASNGGGLYYGYPESPGGAIRNCVFYDNAAFYRGGGVEFDHCDEANMPVISNCVIYNNVASTAGTYGGGGIYGNHGLALVKHCTIVGNDGGPGAGGVHGWGGHITVTNTVIAFSSAGPAGYGVYADHCVIFGNAGGDTLSGQPDNLYQDPLFCNIFDDNFMVCENSPCLAGNNSWVELIGAFEQGCGSCDAPVEATAWGSIKSLFR